MAPGMTKDCPDGNGLSDSQAGRNKAATAGRSLLAPSAGSGSGASQGAAGWLVGADRRDPAGHPY
jgi:hypothetical protein